MNKTDETTVTALLAALRGGDRDAQDRLVTCIYDEFHVLAKGLMRHERRNHTLQPTALVNEALLRLLRANEIADLRSRRHFFAAAARAMRRILVEHAVARSAKKRGGGAKRVPLDEILAVFEKSGIDFLAFNKAVALLDQVDSRQREFIELYYFAGMSKEEIAEIHGLTSERVRQVLRETEAWIRDHLDKE